MGRHPAPRCHAARHPVVDALSNDLVLRNLCDIAAPRHPAVDALSNDLVLRNLCDVAAPAAVVGLARVCRALAAAVERQGAYAYAGFPPRALGRRGLTAALAARWRAGAPQDELDAALLGAAEGGRAAAVRWLYDAGLPSAGAAAEALTRLVAGGHSCEALEAILGSRAAPPYAATAAAFATACGCGKLGYAEALYRDAYRRRALPPHELQLLLVCGLEAAGEAPSLRHVVAWARGALRWLERGDG